MIPKIIHYCWFGRGEKPKLAIKCINSWKKFCPDYRIIEWNEDNYDIASAPLFVRQALEAKKWAFATDYIRYQVVYEYGGIYMDIDVELRKSLDGLLKNEAFFGFEKGWGKPRIASGLGFGAEKGIDFIRELMGIYEQTSFLQADGSMDNTSNTKKEFSLFLSHGLRDDGTEQCLDGRVHIYPPEYFAPLDYTTGEMKRTRNTVSIHWYGFSWGTKEQQKKCRLCRWKYHLHTPRRLLRKILGSERYEKFAAGLKPFFQAVSGQGQKK